VDPVTDETLWERSVPGRMRVKVVSPEARFVALSPDTGRYLSQPRQTRLIVTGRDVPAPTTIDLAGNFEPEAFSVDGQHLFVVQYLPAARPTRYQVRRLHIATGEVQDVFSVDAELQEAMRGAARVQEMSPDGTRLYTLYSVNTPEGRHSFVHVLSLDELWAHCIDLPHGFALNGPKRSAVGVSPDGERIYVADTEEGMVAELDAQELTVSRTATLDLASAFKGAEVTVAADGASVFVGTGAHVIQLSTEDLSELGRWGMTDGISGIQVGSSSNIYVGTRDEVAVIDTTTGKQTDILQPAGVQSITGLGPVTRGLDPARTKLTAVKG
jgi:DNA-binding beta-propeller fold protein YncE